jgi:pilus assembly protein CpaC
MKPARSILPAIDQTIEEANGRRVAAARRGVAGAVVATGRQAAACGMTGRIGIEAASRGRSASHGKPLVSDDESGRPSSSGRCHAVRFGSTTMSAPTPRASRKDCNMTRPTLIRTASLAALVTTLTMIAINPTSASDQRVGGANTSGIEVVGSDLNSRLVSLGIGKSVVIDLPRDIKDVLIADPKIANAVIRSARRAYIIGAAVGQTNIFFFDAEGRQIAGFDIAVKRDLNGIRGAIKQALPTSDVQVEAVGDSIVLTGNVASAAEAQMAFDIATRLLGAGTNPITIDGSKVVNAITVLGHDQVMLKVTVAEVKRSIIKQLGVNLNGSLGYGATVLNINNANPFPISGTPPDSIVGHFSSVTATLQALEQAGVIHTLAEPTLTAISGESATFIAGGKFPYPTPPNSVGGAAGYSWQTFGVSLAFTPVVLSEGRISLKVMTEVSELAPENSVTIVGTTVPGITTRNVDTTLEIPSGGSLAMAGMIQTQTKQTISGLPGLMQLPVLGALFKSRDYLNSQTELMVIVTPYIVRSVALKNLSRPDDGFADASDPASILLGNLNRIYGVPGNTDSKTTYRGNYGFILD